MNSIELVESKYDGVFRAWVKMSYVQLGWAPKKVQDIPWRNPETWVCVATNKDKNECWQEAKKKIR